MTPLNAEKYLRGLPLKQDREAADRLALLCDAMGISEAEKRIYHISCAGAYTRHTADMLCGALEAAKIPAVGLFFEEPPMGGYERSVLVGRKKLTPYEFADTVEKLRKAARACGIADSVGISEALTAIALFICADRSIKVLVTDVSALPIKTGRILPPASLVILGSLTGDSGEMLPSLISKATEETVCAPQTPEMHGRITDRCAEAGCRLTVAARTGLPGGPEMISLSLGGISFIYRGIRAHTPSVFVSSLCCASAAIDGVRALRRGGFDIPDEAVVQGIRRADTLRHGSVISLRPVVLAEALPCGGYDPSAYFSWLASDIAALRNLTGEGGSIFWLTQGQHEGATPRELLSALEKRQVKVLSVYGVEKGETMADAARRVARDIVITDEEIDADPKATFFGRSFLVIGERSDLDMALPCLCSGITRTMI